MKNIFLFFLLFIVQSRAFESNAQSNAIIKNSYTRYLVHSIHKAEISKEYEIQILNKEGLDFSRFIDYQDKFKKVRQLEVTVYDRNGNKVKKLGRDDALDVKFNSSYEIDDSRILILFPKYEQYPFTIKVETKSVYNGFISLPTWMPRYEYGLEVESAILELEYPIEYDVKILEEFITLKAENQSKTAKTLKWEVNHLAAINKELNKISFTKMQPKILMTPLNFELEETYGSYASWKDFGNWFVEINEGRNELLTDTKNYLDNLRSLKKYDLIREIYHYMQDKTRYISIQLGIGGFQTIPSDEVERTGYGDCKALTNYMKSMLEYVDIPSNYILVRAGSQASEVKADFPSNQFNHVFLGIPSVEDTILLECTSQLLPVNYIGEFTDDRNVLWIEKDNSKIIRSRIYDEEANLKITKGKIVIDENGGAIINSQTSNRGIFYDELMRYKHISNEDALQHHYKNFEYNDFTIDNLSFSQMNRDSVDFSLDFTINVKNLAKNSLEKMLIPLNVWLSIESELNIESISSSVDIRRGFKTIDEFEVVVPESFWLKKPILNKTLNSEFGSYNITVEDHNGTFKIKKEVIIKKGFYENESFELFHKFINKIKRVDNSKIVLDSKT